MELRRIACIHLAGAAPGLTGWWEQGEIAVHLRRRLSNEEQLLVGCAVDLRKTEEGVKRLEAIRDVLPPPAIRMALREIRGEL